LVGDAEGDDVGDLEGCLVGFFVGCLVGDAEGDDEGLRDGDLEGCLVGSLVIGWGVVGLADVGAGVFPPVGGYDDTEGYAVGLL
jgi:hypothetical protein